MKSRISAFTEGNPLGIKDFLSHLQENALNYNWCLYVFEATYLDERLFIDNSDYLNEKLFRDNSKLTAENISLEKGVLLDTNELVKVSESINQIIDGRLIGVRKPKIISIQPEMNDIDLDILFFDSTYIEFSGSDSHLFNDFGSKI